MPSMSGAVVEYRVRIRGLRAAAFVLRPVAWVFRWWPSFVLAVAGLVLYLVRPAYQIAGGKWQRFPARLVIQHMFKEN